MRLPSMRYVDRIVKSTQIKFGGLAHTPDAGNGALWDMRNLCSDMLPVLSVRPPRYVLGRWPEAGGIYAWENLCMVNGTSFLYAGIHKGTVKPGRKVFACLAPYILIFPDKAYYNYETDTFGSMEAVWTGNTLTFGAGVAYDETAQANAITCEGVNWADYFRVGDAVTISGCIKHPANNKTPIIRGISGDKLYFSENCFTLDGSDGTEGYTEEGDLKISRDVPDLEHICQNENRLFGCAGNTIYASKLGDPFNWNVFDGLDTDSWQTQTGSSGSFTGCIAYGGYPIFFKEDQIYKVYGSYPSNYSLQGSATLGLLSGCGASLAVAGEVLFYLGRNGVMAYSGGIPQLIGEELGNERLKNAVAGSDGLKYYLCAEDADGSRRVYVYDTQRRVWFRESDTDITHFARLRDRLYYMRADGTVCWIGSNEGAPAGKLLESSVPWMAEFADFTENDPNKKGFSKLQLRFKLDENATLRALVQYDSDGQWHLIRQIVGGGRKKSIQLPVIPRRCDHYRLRLEGEGGCEIFSITRQFYVGSEI